MGQSEVAVLRAQMAQEAVAMQRGLDGYAVSARHVIIEQKYRRLGELTSQLRQEVGAAEALGTLVDTLEAVHPQEGRRPDDERTGQGGKAERERPGSTTEADDVAWPAERKDKDDERLWGKQGAPEYVCGAGSRQCGRTDPVTDAGCLVDAPARCVARAG